MKAGEHKLLYAPIDENGWQVHKRTARHVTTLMTILQVHNMLSPDKTVSSRESNLRRDDEQGPRPLLCRPGGKPV